MSNVKYPFAESAKIEDSLKIKVVELQLELSKQFKGIHFMIVLPYLHCFYEDREAKFNMTTLQWEAVITDIEEFFNAPE